MYIDHVHVFDAYGTLFDVDHACKEMASKIGNKWDKLSSLWRQKQLEYSWLYNSMNNYKSFWKITEDSLDYSLKFAGIDASHLREDLLSLYFKISAFKEVKDFLKNLKQKGITTAILSNGSYDMLNSAVKNSGLSNLLTDVISVDECKKFKPNKQVYELILTKFKINKKDVVFFSSNCWDIHGASNFGFQTVWVNRKNNIDEFLPGKVDYQVQSLENYITKE